jgi:hypothetical protein
MPPHKIVVSNAELKAALRQLGKRRSTGRYRRKLLDDLIKVKDFGNYLILKSKENKTKQDELDICSMENPSDETLTTTEKE